jgi:hypothetical protein
MVHQLQSTYTTEVQRNVYQPWEPVFIGGGLQVLTEGQRVEYSPQITSRSPQEMRAFQQCKIPRAEVMFVTTQCENIRPSKKGMNKDVKMLIIKIKLSDVCS